MAAKMAILELSNHHPSRNISQTTLNFDMRQSSYICYMQSDLTAKNVNMLLINTQRPISSRLAILVRFGIKYIYARGKCSDKHIHIRSIAKEPSSFNC